MLPCLASATATPRRLELPQLLLQSHAQFPWAGAAPIASSFRPSQRLLYEPNLMQLPINNSGYRIKAKSYPSHYELEKPSRTSMVATGVELSEEAL